MIPLSFSARELPFSYTCNRCSLCCKEKIIRVNPYEVVRLAARFEISTSYFLKVYTMAQGTVLKVPYNGYCVFRNYAGCAVHQDRPLVCRLYPLRRNTADDHTETFTLVETEPRCVALLGDKGTINEYLADQETDEYVRAVDRYIDLADRLTETLRKAIERDRSLAEQAARLCTAPEIYRSDPVPDWLDIDRVVSSFCTRRGLPLPKTPFEKTTTHIAAVNEMCADTTFVSDKSGRVRTLARTVAVLGYSIGVNLDELSADFLSIFENNFT
jgi:Fe-S-cluster containining protein